MTTRHTTTLLLAAAIGAGALSGCRGERTDDPPRQFFPDMDDAPKWKPQSESAFFEDSRTMRPRVAGTVAFGDSMDPADADRARFLKDDLAFFTGVDEQLLEKAMHAGLAGDASPRQPDGSAAAHDHAAHAPPPDADIYLVRMPVAPTPESIAIGRGKFNIYCAACHGYKGDGKGLAGARWSYPVPSFHDPKYSDPAQKTGKDGYLFHTAMNGVPDVAGKPPKMPGYGHALTESEAWGVVAYLRVLQAQWVDDASKVPANLMDQIRDKRPAPPPPEPAAAPAKEGGAQ